MLYDNARGDLLLCHIYVCRTACPSECYMCDIMGAKVENCIWKPKNP